MYRPFRRLGERLRNTQPIFRYKHMARFKTFASEGFEFSRNYLNVHQSLVLLTLFIIISNTVVVRASSSQILKEVNSVPLEPYKIADTVRFLAPYMADIDQDPDAIAIILEEQINGAFISSNPLIATQEAEDEIVPPAPTTPSKRTSDIKYTVEIGDTLSGISKAYNISIDTIKVKNNLKDVDAIKPGQVLTIPASNLSEKAIAAAQSRSKKTTSLSKSTQPTTGKLGFITPIKSNGVTRRLIGGHTGIDYRANTGTAVYAADDGVVISSKSGWNGGFGVNILINHGSNVTTRYAHLSSYVVVGGQTVNQGQLIGYSGNTGRSTGPHLHFETRVNGRAIDPGT